MKKVTVIGGGTGSFVVLSALKQYPIDLAAIVTMMDSGGSTGRLRDQLGVLPAGDLRQCLVALSDAPLLWRQLFSYRFENGDLKGHNFGNIFLSALEKVTENYDEVLEAASHVLKTKGQVFPVTYDHADLCVEYESGKIIKGETHIDEKNFERSRIRKAYLEPTAKPNPKVLERIKESDYIIVGPGDLYTSIIPVVSVEQVKEAIIASNAKLIYNVNLMTKTGQTTGYTARDHVIDIITYFGRRPDYVIIHVGDIPEEMVAAYEKNGEQRVINDVADFFSDEALVTDDLIDRSPFQKIATDAVTRSILRHDAQKLAHTLKKVIQW